uniref:uncharacterized protein LOC109961691 n=1 Tax=Monopterus albus TaxID=43700 RepID=UPI0009B4A9DC|nr:uncharacterized protein LOC109961691 [Monopterus albus]
MVHSGSASPMKTTLSASPHLTLPATAPPRQVAPPLVPPLGDTTGQDQTPAKLLTTDLTSNSNSAHPSTPSLADAEAHVVTLAKALTTNSGPASARSSTQTPIPTHVQFNGRTSSRKRTPKACDCCGPNSTGHNVRTSGRGRGRGRGRGAGGHFGDTPKRRLGGQLTRIRSFDLTKEIAEDEDDTSEKMQKTVVVADTQSRTPVSRVVTSLQGGLLPNCGALDKGDIQKNEDALIGGSGVAGAVVKGAGNSMDVEMRLSGMAGRGALVVRRRGRGVRRATIASKMKVEGDITGGDGGGVISSENDAVARSQVAQKQEESRNAQMDHGEQTDSIMVRSPFGNGDTVDLSDTEPEGEAKEDNIIMCETGNELLSISQQLGPASRSETLQDPDSEMQEDQIPDTADQASLPVTLPNGNITTPTDHNRSSTPMEVGTSHPSMVSPPNQCPITVCSLQHHWALRDHMLYCHIGTWKEDMSGKDQSEDTKTDGKTHSVESLEQLTDLVHGKLFWEHTPLSETDVLEYLRNKGNSDLSNRGLDIKGEMTRYRAGLASAPIAGFMVMYNKHTLSLEDLGTLEEQNWLNDQIINMYGELIMEATQHKVHFFNSFFHKQLVAKGYDGVKRWTKKVDLFSKWLLLIPIHLEIHWSLVTVTMATKTISYYDSQGIVFRHTTDNIMKYLQSEAREKKQTAFQKGWKITIIKGIPQQKNDSDCGVFVLEYCRRLSIKQPLQFTQEDMPHIRKRIYKELCDCRLND